MTERPHFHFSLSCIGEGNGNPLQCSCLENPRDRGAWWAAVSGVAQSRTRLTRLSSSSSSRFVIAFLPRSKYNWATFTVIERNAVNVTKIDGRNLLREMLGFSKHCSFATESQGSKPSVHTGSNLWNLFSDLRSWLNNYWGKIILPQTLPFCICVS